MKAYAPVFDALYHAGEQVQLPGFWEEIPCHDAFRVLSDERLREVCRLFDERQLLSAGIYVGTAGSCDVSPLLREPPVTLLFLRRRGEEGWYQVVSHLHGLAPHVGAFAAALQDTNVVRWIEEMDESWEVKSVPVTARMSDLPILWSLEIPAIPATGLHALGRAHLDVVYRRLRQLGRDGAPLFLDFVACDWATLQKGMHPYVSRVRAHLDAIADNLRHRFRTGLWQPTNDTFTKLAFARRYGGPETVKELVIRSYYYDEGATEEHVSGGEADAGGPPDLDRAAAQLRAAYGRPDGVDRQHAWRQFHEATEIAISQPLMAKALLAADPEDRMRLAGKAAFAPIAIGELSQIANKAALPALDPRHAQARLSEGEWARALELLNSLTGSPPQKAARHVRKR